MGFNPSMVGGSASAPSVAVVVAPAPSVSKPSPVVKQTAIPSNALNTAAAPAAAVQNYANMGFNPADVKPATNAGNSVQTANGGNVSNGAGNFGYRPYNPMTDSPDDALLEKLHHKVHNFLATIVPPEAVPYIEGGSVLVGGFFIGRALFKRFFKSAQTKVR